MRIPSGKTDQYIYFVAYDSTDHTTRKTGLSGFAVYRSRNNGAATAYTTPTVSELSAANMPGLYALLIDEDTTIASGSDSEEYTVHITVSGMDPVTRAIELYRRDTTSGGTLTVTSGLASADVSKINSVSTSSVTTVNANVGTTQPVNFTGTGATAYVKSDLIDIAGSAVSTSSAQLGVNVVNIGGAAVSTAVPIGKTLATVARGTATTGATTTSIPTSALSIAGSSASGVVADQFKNRVVVFDGDTTTAGLRGAASTISASSASNTPTLTVGTLPATPASGDTFSII